MRAPSYLFRQVLTITFACVALLFASSAARAQVRSPGTLNLKISAQQFAAVSGATVVYRHALPANTPAAGKLRARDNTRGLFGKFGHSGPPQSEGNTTYPADLTYLGGSTVPFAQFHAIYMLPNGSCPISVCWGDPEGFLRHLGRSNFIQLSDQYLGVFGANRYFDGSDANVSYTPPSVPLTDADIEAVVYLVASATQETGYGHIYHVFLPPGQDECFDSTYSECYSPDNPNSFYFCGYHSSVDFPGLGHVLYTVLPYADVPGCSVKPGTPNGMLADSADNVLSHETFETITDPDGASWWNYSAVVLFGDEIGDECEFVTFIGPNGDAYFNPPTFNVGGHVYAVQSEYSNDAHACTTTP